MIKLIIAKLIILQISVYIISQFAQSYTHFEIYSKIWICWIQSKIWCWRDQIDFLDDRIVWYNFIEIRFAMFYWFEFWMFYMRFFLNIEIFWDDFFSYVLSRNFEFCFWNWKNRCNRDFRIWFEKSLWSWFSSRIFYRLFRFLVNLR